MASKDVVSKAFLNKDDVFADAVNNALFQGRRWVDPTKITERDPEELLLNFESQEFKSKYRDLLKNVEIKTDQFATYVVIGIENQSNVDYTIPIRVLWYDAMEYDRQLREKVKAFAAEQKRKEENGEAKEKLSPAEFLSHLPKNTIFKPVITIVIYLGTEPWDGSEDLHAMFGNDFPKELLGKVNNWNINLLNPQSMKKEEFATFTSELGAVLKFIKYAKDKEALRREINSDPRFANMSDEAVNMLNQYCDKKIKKVKNAEGEGNNMCLAIQEMIDEEYERGEARGYEKQAKQTARNLKAMGMTEAMIAKALEASEVQVQQWLAAAMV